MTTLYLRHRATSSDPWQELDPAVFPNAPVGAIAVRELTVLTGQQYAARCCGSRACSCECGSAEEELYAVLRVSLQPVPLANAWTLLNYLLQFKSAALHESRTLRFAAGAYVTSELSLLTSREENGYVTVSFRLASLIADSVTA